MEFSVKVNNAEEFKQVRDDTCLDLSWSICRPEDYDYPTHLFIEDNSMLFFGTSDNQFSLEEVLTKFPKQSKEA